MDCRSTNLGVLNEFVDDTGRRALADDLFATEKQVEMLRWDLTKLCKNRERLLRFLQKPRWRKE